MSKDKRTRKYLIIGITLVTLLEIYFAYRIVIDYRGIYQVAIFIPLVFQPFLYHRLIRKDLSHLKIRIFVLGLVSVLLPLTIYFTLPHYTYDEGKQIIEQYIGHDTVFTDYPFNRRTVPTSDNGQLFVNNRAYYYEVVLSDGKKYFIVDPLTGHPAQLPEAYWKDMVQ